MLKHILAFCCSLEYAYIAFVLPLRRVHISEKTASALGDQFQLEPGDGGERDDYLREHDIKTFLVAVPEVSVIIL